MKYLTIPLLCALATGCTSVTADLGDGTSVSVVTFATSRQDIDIGRDETGTHWRAANSSPDQTLAKAILQLTEIVAQVPGR